MINQFFDKKKREMLNQSSERSSTRGSCFIDPSASVMSRGKPKKNIFSVSSTNDFYGNNFDFHYKAEIGDSNEKIAKADPPKTVARYDLERKKSKTIVVDKRNLNHGYFAKFKKRKQEELSKFNVQRTNELEADQTRRTIEEIQLRIDQISKMIESKLLIQAHQEVEIQREDFVEVVDVDVERKSKLNSEKVLKSAGIAAGLIIIILLILYLIEGKYFFSSIISPGSVKLNLRKARSFNF